MEKKTLEQIKQDKQAKNHCSKWTVEEERALIQKIHANEPYKEIAVAHERTEGGITSRLKKIAIRMIETFCE